MDALYVLIPIACMAMMGLMIWMMIAMMRGRKS